jgi:hypothetical protein
MHERNHHREPEMVDRDFWGQLLKIFVLQLTDEQAQSLGQPTARPVVLASIRRVDAKKSKYGIVSYKHERGLDVVDVNSLQCVVGRVYYDRQWFILDRSAPKERAIFGSECNIEESIV